VRIEDEIFDYINARSDRTLDPHMVNTMIYWFLSVVVNKKKRKLIVGHNNLLLNYYGLVFAKSNSGKSFILNLLLKMFNESDYEKMLLSLFNSRTSILPNGEQNDTALQRKFIKAFPPIKKDSTTQAIHKAAEAIGTAACTNGSFNIYSDEFFANASEPILDMLVEGHDGIYKAPMIKGKKDEEFLEYNDIEGLTTNVLGLSSVAAIMKDQKRLSSFIGEMERAWFKRSFVYFNDSFKTEFVPDELTSNPEPSNELKYLLDMGREAVTECPVEITVDPDTLVLFHKKRKEYINGDNKSRFAGLLDIYKTLKLAGILACSNFRTTISVEDWNKAVKFDEESFRHSENFCSLEHPHIRVFAEVSKGSQNEHELVESGIMPGAKNKRADILELVNQLAYKKNKRFVIAGDKIRKFSIVDLEINKLDKMIISTSAKRSAKPEMEINFKSQEVAFFGSGMSVEGLLTSNVQSYCLNHFEATDKAPDGHRKKEYVIPGQNMIAWDIDEGMSIAEMKNILEPYQYLMYTTKSHRKDKGGVICDRFRVIIPTKTTFYVNPEEHKGLYENLARVLNIPSYDVATRNQGRLWFVNPEGQVFKKEDGDLLDVRCCIPETEVSEHIIPNIENLDLDESDRRIAGMQKFVLINGVGGNRNNVIFRLAKFIKELDGSVEEIVYSTNAMLLEPLPENEVRTILQNI
jgi:hypothetical protein